jgi:hypothetical protein
VGIHIQLDTDGFLAKFKARLVVRGDLQRPDGRDNYAVTLASRVFRALMAIAAQYDLDIHQLDAVNAFTNSDMDSEVNIRCVEGFGKLDHHLLLLPACIAFAGSISWIPRPLLDTSWDTTQRIFAAFGSLQRTG